MNASIEVAKILLEEKAVFFRPDDPFTWTSGIKSPIYCDNRLLISNVKARTFIINSFLDHLKELNFDVVAGTATAGIPWAAWIAQELNLPLTYVRSSSKNHGRQNSIEGVIQGNENVILIEDLISTGKSSLSAAQKIQETGAKVISILSIFNYDFKKTKELFHQNKLRVNSLSGFDVLAGVAYEQNFLMKSELEKILAWKEEMVLS